MQMIMTKNIFEMITNQIKTTIYINKSERTPIQMTKTKDNCKSDILLLIFMFILLLFFLFFNVLVSMIKASNYPKLEDSIEEVESLLGDYSEFYVAINGNHNITQHTIYNIDYNDDLILLVPNTIMNTFVVDIYTSWDENIGSYNCDFSKDYVIKGKHIKLIKSSLPFVFIDVNKNALNSVNDSYRDGSNAKVKASVEVTSRIGDSTNTSSGIISPRGSATWHLYKKKPYSLKLTYKNDMFKLGDYKKYNLLANASDKTLLKNEVFFDLANAIGLDYTPKITNVNMFFNNHYKGVYSISTKVKDKKIPMDLDQGDYLICWGSPRANDVIYYDCDFWTDDSDIAENSGAYVSLEWPEEGEYTKATKEKVQKIVQNYIDVLEGRKEGKLSDYVDLESLAKYYWIQEIGMNSDGWYRSTYTYYKKNTGKLYYGPLWDMEFVLGANVTKNDISFRDPKGWVIRRNAYYVPLFKNEEFVKEVERVYYDYNIEDKMYKSYNNFCDKVDDLSLEGEINYQLWYNEGSFYDTITVDDANTYSDYCKIKIDFYKERIDWIANEMRKSKNN